MSMFCLHQQKCYGQEKQSNADGKVTEQTRLNEETGAM